MNKYELALVVSANVEDEVRNATVEQVKELITRFGGTITDPGTCEKKKLAYEIQTSLAKGSAITTIANAASARKAAPISLQ